MISTIRPLILALEHLCNYQYYSDKDIVKRLVAKRVLVLRFITSTTNTEAGDTNNENLHDQISIIANVANNWHHGNTDEAKVVYHLSKINFLFKNMKNQEKPLVTPLDEPVLRLPTAEFEGSKELIVPIINILCRTKESYVYAACIYTLYVNLQNGTSYEPKYLTITNYLSIL